VPVLSPNKSIEVEKRSSGIKKMDQGAEELATDPSELGTWDSTGLLVWMPLNSLSCSIKTRNMAGFQPLLRRSGHVKSMA